MNTKDKKNRLIQTAEEIQSFSAETFEEYQLKIPEMVNSLNQLMLNRDDILELAGSSKNIEMMKDNHSNHAYFIASILKNFDAEVLVDTILWVFRAYRSRQFHPNYWAAQLNTWRKVINEHLSSENAQKIVPLYNWMQVNIPVFTMLSDENLLENKSKHKTN